MAIQNFLIRNLLRLITPEEIGDIATKHNGGKFLSLTDLVNERFDHQIFRDFSSPESVDLIHDEHAVSHQAKILPFKLSTVAEKEVEVSEPVDNDQPVSLTDLASSEVQAKAPEKSEVEKIEHKENENMSSFILIEKARLKRSQQILKQKEIIDLYQKNSYVDVEQIKGSNNSTTNEARESGVLINKKQY